MSHNYPPAFCPEHGFFPAVHVALGVGSRQNTIMGSVPCPTCHRPCDIVPGVYDSHAGHLDILLDPSISPEILTQLREIAKRAERKEITPEEAKVEAEKLSPKAGKLFDIANWSDSAKSTLYSSIIGAAALILAAGMTAGGSGQAQQTTTIERVIDTRRERLKDSTSLPYIPIPTPRPK